MRYWWVNQNQTYRHEIRGQYLWSPKRKSNDDRNPFYEFMREVAPGDIIFSFFDARIAAIGIARSYCYESPKPTEFGNAGSNWGPIGWKVDTAFHELTHRIRPKEHIEQLRDFLPEKYAPLRLNGDGLQSVYLTKITEEFASMFARLIGPEAHRAFEAAAEVGRSARITPAPESTLEEWEHRVEVGIRENLEIPDTERQALILSRRGQGRFRESVRQVERACRITKVQRAEHLVASHVKPWRDSTNEERLDGENGLLLTPTIDHLFDKGFISFENSGDLILSPLGDRASLQRMGVDTDRPVNVGTFSEGQRRFLDYHRDNVLRMARTRRG
jgi:putative restriction endonuclease